MEKDELLGLIESKPGILLIKSLARDHPEVRDVRPLVENTLASDDEIQLRNQWPDGYPGPPTLEEVRILNGAAILAVFKDGGYRAGDCISQGDVQKHLMNYVLKRGLRRTNDPK
ncbi:unnamed protein product [Echinostoma caproni]|uniref:SLH domain-containing protein n=1 Tax=Echinostoma caproni TaxID=27848 RepID=A0A183B179_9TREM|nr:unnamed protein product [Echinostoma caproni]